MFTTENGSTRVVVPLEPSGSVFVVFRNHADSPSSLACVKHDGKTVLSTAAEPAARIVVRKAVYGILGDPARTRDVRAKVQQIVDAGEDHFNVARLAGGDDPAFNIVKTLVVDYAVGDQPCTARGTDPETIVLASVPAAERIAEVRRELDGHLCSRPGNRDVTSCPRPRAPGRSRSLRCPTPWNSPGPGKLRFHRTAAHPRKPPSSTWSRGLSTPIPV